MSGKTQPLKNMKAVENSANPEDIDDFDGSEEEYSDAESADDENDDEDDDEEEEDDDEENEDEDDDSDDSFEIQSGDSSDSDDDDADEDESDDQDEKERSSITKKAEKSVRQYRNEVVAKNLINSQQKNNNSQSTNSDINLTELLNTDDVSSDEEDNSNLNTIGRVPLHWYDAYDHIGYNIQGEKLIKRSVMGGEGGKDRIDMAIENRDNIEKLHTVYDMYNDREVVLSARDLEIIQRIQAGTFAHPEHDDTPDYVDYFSSIKEIMPLSKRPLPKSKFLPSKWEMLKVKKILKSMKNGTYKTIAEREAEKKNKDNKPFVYNIWNEDDDPDDPENRISKQRAMYHLPAPKMPLPSHAESYNPPNEYLLTDEEKQEMLALDPSDRQYNFIPQKFSSLRHVSGYSNFVLERFERCLDLYLCPRKLKLRLNIDPETLVPRYVSTYVINVYVYIIS